MDLMHVHAVHTRRKSRWNPSAVDECITRAVHAQRGVPRSCYVFANGEIVGIVRGESTGRFVRWQPWDVAGFPSYDALNRALKGGQGVTVYFNKDVSTFTNPAQWRDCWGNAGNPGAGDWSGTANTARQFNNTTTGAIRIEGKTPTGGAQRYLAGWSAGAISGTNVGMHYWLYDRVLGYDGCSITTSTTTFTNTLTAQRYISSGDEGLLVCAEASVGTGATAANLTTLTFTDQAGTAAVAQSAGYTLVWQPSSASPGTGEPTAIVCPFDSSNGAIWTPFLPMAAGVSGVRKLETMISSAINTGTISMVLMKPLGHLWTIGAGSSQMVDLSRALFSLVRVYDDACLSMLINADAGRSSTVTGHLRLVHG